MEFKRTELELTIYGQKCKLRFPVMREFREFSKKAANASEQDSLDLTKDFLCSLGMSEQLFEELEPDHMRQIIESVTSKQKKS